MAITGLRNPRIATITIARTAKAMLDENDQYKLDRYVTRLNEACYLFQEMKPRDAIECYLCQQIIVCHKNDMQAIETLVSVI